MGKYDVKYHNDMNLVSIGALNSSQIDILFSIGLTMSTNYSDKATITFNEIKGLSNYKDTNIKNFYKDLEGLFKKLLDLDFRIETETNIKRMNLFQYYDIQKDNGVVEIKANEIFLKLFDNMLRGNFTLFDLKDLVSLKSGYSKLMFKLLKGWNGKKKIDYTLEEIYHLLGVPLSMQTTANFTNKVMKPIKEELPKYFNKLEIEPIKTGRKITGYNFTWKTNPKTIQLLEDNIIHISEKLHDTIEKSKRNRFIKPFLNNENIVKLLEKFNQDQLIKGLNHAYIEVKQEVKYLSYLIKAIESGIEKQEIKILINNPASRPKDIEVIETVGERKEDQVEVQEVKYTKNLDGAKRFLFARTTSIKIPNKMNIINNLKDLESAIEFGEKYSIDMNFFKEDEVVEDLIEITASEYDMLKSRHVFNLLIESEGNIILQEAREKFDIENKHKYKIVDVTTEHLRELLKEEGIELEVVIEELKNAKYPTDNNFLFKFITVIKTAKNKNSTEEILNSIGLK